VIAVVLLAAGEQTPEDVGKSPPLGLLLLVLGVISAIFLVRSMSGHLKKVPRSFDPADDLPVVPDTPQELLERREPRPQPGNELLDRLRRAPRAIEPPRRADGGRSASDD
jgi:hypothetical protein